MDSSLQILVNHRTAPGAQLRCVSGVNQHNTTTSAFRLVRSELHKFFPAHIRNAPVDLMVPVGLHPLNIQVLKSDELIGINQLPAFLMGEILTPVGLPLVGVLQGADNSLALWAALWKRFFLSLEAGDISFIAFHPVLAGDLVAIRMHGKRCQSQINANHPVIGRQKRLVNIAGKAGVPVPDDVAPDGQSLDGSFHRAVLNQPQRADFGKHESSLSQSKPGLLEREAIVAVAAPKAWVAGCLARFDASEESLKSQIDALLRVLQHLRVNLGEFGFGLLPGGQQLVGVIERERFLLALPGVLAGRQRFVINPAAKVQRLPEQSALVSR